MALSLGYYKDVITVKCLVSEATDYVCDKNVAIQDIDSQSGGGDVYGYAVANNDTRLLNRFREVLYVTESFFFCPT